MGVEEANFIVNYVIDNYGLLGFCVFKMFPVISLLFVKDYIYNNKFLYSLLIISIIVYTILTFYHIYYLL